MIDFKPFSFKCDDYGLQLIKTKNVFLLKKPMGCVMEAII